MTVVAPPPGSSPGELEAPGTPRLAVPLPPAQGLRLRRSALGADHWYGSEAGRFYKVAMLSSRARRGGRSQDLHGEAALLLRCHGVPGIPRVLGVLDGPRCQVLILERIAHPPLSRLACGWRDILRITVRLALIVARLAWRGVSHNDLRPENVLVAPDGRVWLIDFDQASRASCVRCLLAGAFGINPGSATVHNSLAAPLRKHLQARLPPRLVRLLKGRRARRAITGAASLPGLPADASRELRLLHEAWRIAATSQASSPGLPLAYYELTFQGVTLPGERPWRERWQQLRAATDYRGKRVLELGCNSALLSVFLLAEAGAAACCAVDHDADILAAAARVAEAFHVEPSLRRVEFDRDPGWEEELAAFRPDVVFALSVLHWLADQPRFLAFLARFEEVVFEGHDRPATERRRLIDAGFAQVELIGTSERGRPILLCRRSAPGP